MKSLVDYPVIVNETFYKCWHILEYLEKHKDISELDIEAIQATIMDALVYHNDINPQEEFLSLDNLAITNNPDDYHYTMTPNVCGIPMAIKEELRKKCLYISAGVPVTLFLAKPPSKIMRYCVYDPNTAFSSIFDDFTFYEAIYTSPTRGVRLTDSRPFVEVKINNELYLVDTITNRIFKSAYFKEKYDLVVVDMVRKSEFNYRQQKLYVEQTQERCSLADVLMVYEMNKAIAAPELAEQNYEVERSKELYPEAWEEYKRIQEDMKLFFRRDKNK